jgi:hypothetical protein
MPRRPKSEPTPVSIVLKSVVKAPELTQDAQKAIWEGIVASLPSTPFTPHRSCPCLRCHEFYGTLLR